MAAEEMGASYSGGAGPLVVFVSSVTPAGITYGPLLGEIGDEVRAQLKDLEVLARDTPLPDFEFDAEVEGIKSVADDAGEESIHLVGFSAGASAALAFAAKYPGRVASLALIEPPFIGGEGRTPEEKEFWATGDEAMELPPPERMGAFLGMLLRPGVKPPERPPGPPPPWMLKQPAALAALHRSFKEYNLDTESLRDFRNPVYMAFGSLSNVAWERMAERLRDMLPSIEVEVYEDRHHLDAPHAAEPERFARALRKLWARAGSELAPDASEADASPAT